MHKLRIAAVLALTAPAVTAAVAQAAPPKPGTFIAPKGQIQLGYDMKFKVDKGGKRISGLVANVLQTCSGESISQVTTVGPDLTWAVRGGRFSGRLKETEGGLTLYTTLEGRFTSPTTAKGILRQESIVAGATCDTYELKFTARRR